MLVARYEHGELIVIDRLREMVRLAAGLDAGQRISTGASRRALQCLGRFGQRLRDMRAASVRAVGTNTLRKARNAAGFLARAEAELGHPIEVVSGREEARLVYLGAAHSLPDSAGQRLVADIGGGSTELIVGRQLDIQERFSLYMGCVGMTEKYFPNGKISAKRWRRARLAASLELEPVGATLRSLGWDEAVGTSGTIRTTEAVLAAQGWTRDVITPAALDKLQQRIVAFGSAAAISLPGLSTERAPVFAGGVVILQAVLEALGITEMRVAGGALREGLIYDTIGRMGAEDARDRSISALESRYHVDNAQGRRVEQTALTMLAQAGQAWKIDDELSRDLLTWAARVHEMGLCIAHSQYHKHGAYLLEHSDLAGFTNPERTLLATLVMSHRRKIRACAFEDLHSPWDKRLPALTALLRLSVLFHRSRTSASLPPMKLLARKKSLTLSVPGSWLDAHSLTRADLKREQKYLNAIGYELEIDAQDDRAAEPELKQSDQKS